MHRVVFLTGRHISKFVLDDCEHFPNSVKDAASKLVLVVDGQPAAQHLRDSGLQNLSDLQFVKRLLSQDVEVLLLLRFVAKILRIVTHLCHLTEDLLRIDSCSHATLKAVCLAKDAIGGVLFETFLAT